MKKLSFTQIMRNKQLFSSSGKAMEKKTPTHSNSTIFYCIYGKNRGESQQHHRIPSDCVIHSTRLRSPLRSTGRSPQLTGHTTPLVHSRLQPVTGLPPHGRQRRTALPGQQRRSSYHGVVRAVGCCAVHPSLARPEVNPHTVRRSVALPI